MMKYDYSQRRYTYKALLYAENRAHMHILHTIRRTLPQNHVGIWHVLKDENGSEIMHDHGKKHAHIILRFENARRYGQLCKDLGFVDDAGQPDGQFLSPVGYKVDGTIYKKETYERGLCYLVHINTPEKEQYSLSALWGAPRMLFDASRAVDKYECEHLTMAQAVWHVKLWIEEQNRFLCWADLVEKFAPTPLFKALNHKAVCNLLTEHNISRAEHIKAQKEQIALGETRSIRPDEFDIIF